MHRITPAALAGVPLKPMHRRFERQHALMRRHHLHQRRLADNREGRFGHRLHDMFEQMRRALGSPLPHHKNASPDRACLISNLVKSGGGRGIPR